MKLNTEQDKQSEKLNTPRRVIVKQSPDKMYIDGYLISMIDANGEMFRKAFFPDDTKGIKDLIAHLQKTNEYLQIKVSTVSTIVTLERGLTTEKFTYTRFNGDERKTAVIDDITKIFKSK